MTERTGGLLTEGERAQLEARALDAAGHRSLDAEVGYRVRLLAARPEDIDATQIVADVNLLAEHGHNATVALVRDRLAKHLPTEDLP